MTTPMRNVMVGIMVACCGWLVGCGGGDTNGGGLAAPSSLQPSVITTTSITITWSDNSNSETGLEVQRKTTGNWATITTVTANTTQYTDGGLTEGVTYSYRVRALAAGKSSPWSPTVSATPSGVTGVGVVGGRVVSLTTEAPIAGATVTIGGLSATTNFEGQFTISNVPTGSQILTVSASGYFFGSPVTIEVKASANDLGDIKLTPTGAGPPPPPPI